MRPHLLACVFLVGCGLVPQKVTVTDPEVVSLFAAARSFPREEYGFSPLPSAPSTDIRIERHEIGAYNLMLHIYDSTSRTIAFLKDHSGFKWIHEQEIFRGPHHFDSPDGQLQEQICLTYEVEPVSGHSSGGLDISYQGEDERLKSRPDLTLESILPILKEWGYKK